MIPLRERILPRQLLDVCGEATQLRHGEVSCLINTVFGFWVVILPKALAHTAHIHNSSSNHYRQLPLLSINTFGGIGMSILLTDASITRSKSKAQEHGVRSQMENSGSPDLRRLHHKGAPGNEDQKKKKKIASLGLSGLAT